MVFMNTIKILIDISFYLSFAGVAAACFFRNHMTLGFLIALLPVLFYVFWNVFRKNTALSWHRQMDIFSIFWKVYLVFALFVCLIGKQEELITYSVPFALIMLCSSILLLRMLRQEPEVYLNREYQRKNGILLGGIVLTFWMFSQTFVWYPVKYILGFLYTNLLVPILTCLAAILGFLIVKGMGLLAKLLNWAEDDSQHVLQVLAGQSELEKKVDRVVKETNFSSAFWIALVILAIIIGLIFFFRWLNQKWKPKLHHTGGLSMEVHNVEITSQKERESTTVFQVRKQYGKFLKLYQACGNTIKTGDTSKDISQNSSSVFENKDILEEMRGIYIRARYDHFASKADVKRMKQINRMVKHKLNE